MLFYPFELDSCLRNKGFAGVTQCIVESSESIVVWEICFFQFLLLGFFQPVFVAFGRGLFGFSRSYFSTSFAVSFWKLCKENYVLKNNTCLFLVLAVVLPALFSFVFDRWALCGFAGFCCFLGEGFE